MGSDGEGEGEDEANDVECADGSSSLIVLRAPSSLRIERGLESPEVWSDGPGSRCSRGDERGVTRSAEEDDRSRDNTAGGAVARLVDLVDGLLVVETRLEVEVGVEGEAFDGEAVVGIAA